MQTAAETDVRPNIFGDYRIKFKAEALPLKDALGGIRLLFSHNVEFPLSHVHEGDRRRWTRSFACFPALQTLKLSPSEKVELVGDTIVEEVLQDIGILDFGDGISAKANVALWRARGDHRPLIGEFAFQIKFKRREELNEKAMKRAEAFFLALQYAAQGLDRARRDQDRRRLPPEGQSAARARVSARRAMPEHGRARSS